MKVGAIRRRYEQPSGKERKLSFTLILEKPSQEFIGPLVLLIP